MSSVKRPPLWFRIISELLYKLDIVTIWTTGTPDIRWSVTFYRAQSNNKRGK